MSDSSTTDDNSSNLVDMENLDSFSTSFYDPSVTTVGTKEEEPKSEEEIEDDALATETDEDAHEDEKPNEDEPKEEPKPQGKKSAQERINEVVAKQREAERRAEAAEQRIRELEAAKKPEEVKTSDQKPLREQLAETDAPNPDALNEDGTPKYKLGEYDKEYIRDLTKWSINTEREAARKADAEEAQRKMVEASQAELQNSWLQKLEETEKELPDVREHITHLEAEFSNLDPNYGEFLAATIMSCDNGPELMYYLSQNIGEAQKIVASGPAAATLAIGRLDAKLTKSSTQDGKSNKRPSAAPEPPESVNRGSGGKFTARADTENLAAFEKEFYAKK